VSDTIRLSEEELEALTGYTQATKVLRVLHSRGFLRAFINRRGEVVLERTHYEAVSAGRQQELRGSGKVANLSHFRKSA
jgi:hypothetical protein